MFWVHRLVSIDFFCNEPATTEIYTYRHTLSLHDALPNEAGRAAASRWQCATSYRVPSYRRVPDVGAGLDARHPLQGRIDVVLDGAVAADAEIGAERLGDGIRPEPVVQEVPAPAGAPVVGGDARPPRPADLVVPPRRPPPADGAVADTP